MMCEEHKIRCRHEFISPSFSLKIFAHENSQFSQLKRLGKHCAVSALSRRFLCAKLVFKYLVVMTSNYASSGPNQTERLRESKVEGQSIEGETGEEDVAGRWTKKYAWLTLVNRIHALLVHCALSVISSVAQ